VLPFEMAPLFSSASPPTLLRHQAVYSYNGSTSPWLALPFLLRLHSCSRPKEEEQLILSRLKSGGSFPGSLTLLPFTRMVFFPSVTSSFSKHFPFQQRRQCPCSPPPLSSRKFPWHLFLLASLFGRVIVLRGFLTFVPYLFLPFFFEYQDGAPLCPQELLRPGSEIVRNSCPPPSWVNALGGAYRLFFFSQAVFLSPSQDASKCDSRRYRRSTDAYVAWENPFEAC